MIETSQTKGREGKGWDGDGMGEGPRHARTAQDKKRRRCVRVRRACKASQCSASVCSVAAVMGWGRRASKHRTATVLFLCAGMPKLGLRGEGIHTTGAEQAKHQAEPGDGQQHQGRGARGVTP